jgi:hypothetical protein
MLLAKLLYQFKLVVNGVQLYNFLDQQTYWTLDIYTKSYWLITVRKCVVAGIKVIMMRF